MTQHALIAPMFGMAVLVAIVTVSMLAARIYYIRTGKVRMSYFRVMQAKGDLPDPMLRLARNYINLFELPVLFYAAVLVALVTNNTDPFLLNLAWVFVGSRYVHSLIHVTYNNVIHRATAFFVGGIVVLLMWVTIVSA